MCERDRGGREEYLPFSSCDSHTDTSPFHYLEPDKKENLSFISLITLCKVGGQEETKGEKRENLAKGQASQWRKITYELSSSSKEEVENSASQIAPY